MSRQNGHPEGVVDIDGELFPAAKARISVFDRGFLYGDAAFEVVRTYDGVPFCLSEHLARLERSCEQLKIKPPLARAAIAERVARAIEQSGLPDCYLRVVITRGTGPIGLEPGAALVPSVLVYALPLRLLPERVYVEGVSVGVVRVTRPTDGTAAAGAKTSNYLSSVLALGEVRDRGHHEALILGPDDEVVEGATSNVFAVHGQSLLTPPKSAGILEGITRRRVIELACERGLTVEQRRLPLAELLQADELFITSSIRELVPVVSVDEHVVGDGRPGPTTLALLRLYREAVARSARMRSACTPGSTSS